MEPGEASEGEPLAVVVQTSGDHIWAVSVGARLLLVTADEEEAFQTALRASRSDDGGDRPLLLLSGPDRPPEALARQLEVLWPGPGRVGASDPT